MENPIKMDDLGVSLFLETPIYDTRNLKTEQRVYSFEGFDALEYDLFFPFSSKKA